MKIPFEEFNEIHNMLPYDGEALYYPKIEFYKDPQEIYKQLLKAIDWKNDSVKLFGKTIITNRKVALYGDEKVSYTYSNQQKITLPWIEKLLPIKEIVENISGETFNCCLCNLYHDGNDGMGWHRDNEKVLDPNASIASVSFGAERYFAFKHVKNKEKVKLLLENGSLLLMKSPTQKHWFHSLPKSKKINAGRINLTFRTLSSG